MRRMSLAEAFATTFRVRPWIRPNDGFWARLQTLELDERVVNVVRLRYRGDQDRRSLASPKKGTSGADAPSATGGTMISSAGAEVTPLSPGAFTFPPQLSPELPPSTIEEVAHSSPPSTTTPAAIAKKRFGHRRSRTLVKFEDDAATEGSLTTRVMKNMRGEVVERFLRFRHICNTKVFYS